MQTSSWRSRWLGPPRGSRGSRQRSRWRQTAAEAAVGPAAVAAAELLLPLLAGAGQAARLGWTCWQRQQLLLRRRRRLTQQATGRAGWLLLLQARPALLQKWYAKAVAVAVEVAAAAVEVAAAAAATVWCRWCVARCRAGTATRGERCGCCCRRSHQAVQQLLLPLPASLPSRSCQQPLAPTT